MIFYFQTSHSYTFSVLSCLPITYYPEMIKHSFVTNLMIILKVQRVFDSISSPGHEEVSTPVLLAARYLTPLHSPSPFIKAPTTLPHTSLFRPCPTGATGAIGFL